MPKPRYPDVYVPLVGEDGNAFVIIARVRRALQRAGVPAAEIEKFTNEATSGDYDNVLVTVLSWVETIGPPEDDDGP